MRRWTSPFLAACVAAGPAVVLAMPAAQIRADARYHETISGTLVEFEMVLVPGGTVELAGPADPARTEVDAFYIGRTEVTWDMYDVFALGLDTIASGGDDGAVARPDNTYGARDYGWGHAGFPVMSVTRHAAEAFCAWLSTKTGRIYRLPTEAEWQRAADLAVRAEAEAAAEPGRSRDLGAIAWHRGNAERRTHGVATRQPDALGLFDLFGNTAEWVTTTSGDLVTRGGSYRDADVGPAARTTQDSSWNDTDPQLPKSRWWLSDGPFVGFRLAADTRGDQP